VFKLAAEARAPKPEKRPEVNVPAPTGRTTFRGVIVSVKTHESAFGVTLKCTVKVTTPEGVWLAWGTLPKDIPADVERGTSVEITATLSAGREPHFAFFKRPYGKIIEFGAVGVA